MSQTTFSEQFQSYSTRISTGSLAQGEVGVTLQLDANGTPSLAIGWIHDESPDVLIEGLRDIKALADAIYDFLHSATPQAVTLLNDAAFARPVGAA